MKFPRRKFPHLVSAPAAMAARRIWACVILGFADAGATGSRAST
jgi:hypothetical protein